MSSSVQTIVLELAKQGNPDAIALILNRQLQPKGINTKVTCKGETLNLVLEGAQVPTEAVFVKVLTNFFKKLAIASVSQIKVYGKQVEEELPAWQQVLKLPTEEETETLAAAKQGKVEAIAEILNRNLNPKGLTALVMAQSQGIWLSVESLNGPPQAKLIEILEKFFIQLGVNSIQTITVVGRKTGEAVPIWEQTIQLISETAIIPAPETAISPIPEPGKKSGWGSLFGKVTGAATGATGAMGKATQTLAILAGNASDTVIEAVGGAATGATETMGKATQTLAILAGNASDTVIEGVGKAGESAGSAIVQVTGAIANTTMATGNSVTQAMGSVGNAAGQTGEAIAKTTLDMASNLGNMVFQTPDRINDILKIAYENPLMQPFSQFLKADWIFNIVDQVDVVQAKESILKLQTQFPQESPDQISHRVMVQKALLVGATEIATSLPGASILMLAVDLAATTALQAEMVYQIAYAYGFDTEDPARKGEVLAVFGLAFGGGKAVQAGLGFLKVTSIAGAAISASANAALLYALGYAACRFYEAKCSPIVMEATLETLQEESQHYLEAAITQETIMDRILVHMILAGNPDKTWEDLLPELEPMHLSPASLEAISQNIHNPTPLEELLPQINPDFALPLMMQCQKMAELDGIVTPEEAHVLELLSQQFAVEGEAQQGLPKIWV
jgi:uncharacterized protein (DUF697 family)